MEDGCLGYNGTGFEALFMQEEQGPNQIWGGGFEGQQLVHADPHIEGDQWVDIELHAWDSGGDPMELEISQEAMPQLIGGTMRSPISPTSTMEDPSPFTNESPAIENADELASSGEPLPSASNNTTSAEQWHCDFASCGKSFTHYYKLKYTHSTRTFFFSTS